MVNCGRYTPGHQTHWIAALRVYPNAPSLAVKVRRTAKQRWIEVTFPDGTVKRWWHHDADRLVDLIPPEGRTGHVIIGTTFLRFEGFWVYCADRRSRCSRPLERLPENRWQALGQALKRVVRR